MDILKEILDQALSSQYGIALKFSSTYEARYQRRRLYAVREKFRTTGDNQYDGLSLIIQKSAELWIIKRNTLPSGDEVDFLNYRNVTQEELPERILSRGKSRVGLYIS